jgi:threonine/homoserine/homoserine lactone efflux protein
VVFALILYARIMKASAGDEKMQAISRLVQEGAAAFLKTEYKWLAVFVALVAVVIGVASADDGLGPQTAIAFVCGAFASAAAGYFGMHTATRAAVRTTQAARTSLNDALGIAFSSGTVMGMTVVGLALLGVTIFTYVYSSSGTDYSSKVLEHVLGFSFGASSIALFARVGGGIFGLMVHVLLAGLGLGALVAAVPGVFDAIRWVGAAYLVWVAWRTLRTPFGGGGARASSRPFRDGLIVNLSNPKVILFVLALVPQFVDPSRPVLPQFLVLGAVLAVGGFAANGTVGATAGGLGRVLARDPRVERVLRWATAGVFGGLALRLAAMGRA